MYRQAVLYTIYLYTSGIIYTNYIHKRYYVCIELALQTVADLYFSVEIKLPMKDKRACNVSCIYIYIERERDMHTHIHTYVYIYI